MKIRRALSKPIRESASWDERWKATDNGLIACWERGREKAKEDPDLAAMAKRDQLVVLPWRGGIEKPPKKPKKKSGSLNYLAMWRGLRGDDLNIDTESEVALTCSVNKATVVFSSSQSRDEEE